MYGASGHDIGGDMRHKGDSIGEKSENDLDRKRKNIIYRIIGRNSPTSTYTVKWFPLNHGCS
jgi:hypothetical protein